MIYTRSRALALATAFLVTIFSANYLLGQATAAGTIQGTITDKSNAVVSGAQVVATFKATGVTRAATTSDTGSFRFDLLQAGTYEVKVAKQGFATVIQTAELLVGQSATVNVNLIPGAATEGVEVSGTASLVDVEKASFSQSIAPSEVEQVPLAGPDPAHLPDHVPGVKAAGSYDPPKSRYAILS